MKQEKTLRILNILAEHADGAGIDDILLAYGDSLNIRTLQRHLSKLVHEGKIVVSGKARSTLYKLPDLQNKDIADDYTAISVIPLSYEGKNARGKILQPIQKRLPIGYNRTFIEEYQPNLSSYLSVEQKTQLAMIGGVQPNQPAGTYAQQIFNRLLIDLSWNSSRLEGNTYSLLDTERLIDSGEVADSKSAKEAQMILNHKDAIEFIVQSATDIGFNKYTITNLHAMLANNLLSDPQAPGRLRSLAVGITGSVYTPLAVPQLVNEMFDLILSKAEQITDPFEQAFFIMVQLPYLQPFDDVNKRVSRLSANIPLIKNNLSPLSFIDVPEDLYSQGMLAIYELNDVALLKDVFMWAYLRSASRYAVIKQSLGEPDPFKLKYRLQIRELIGKTILDNLNSTNASKLIMSISNTLPEIDREKFIEAVETEILSLHEGNFARYRVSLSEFRLWQKGWQKKI